MVRAFADQQAQYPHPPHVFLADLQAGSPGQAYIVTPIFDPPYLGIICN